MRRSSLLVPVLLAICSLHATNSAALTPFQTEVVDTVGDQGQYSSLVIDRQGDPHVCYYDATNHDLRYAVRSRGVWTYETVDGSTGTDMGQYCALALDSQGNPHISYYDAGNQDLRYATKAGEVWTIQTVDNIGTAGLYTSIAIDGWDNPHIAYRGITGLRYATKSSGSWSNIPLSFTGDVDAISIKIDSGGYPRIAYHDYINQDLDFTWKSTTGWSTEIILNGGTSCQGIINDPGIGVCLALDKHDVPHLSFGGYNCTHSVFYTTKSDLGWVVEAMDSTTYVGQTSIAVDPQGMPHIAYHSTLGRNHLDYISKSILGWTKETVDVVGSTGDYASLSLDGQGNPSIAFYDASDGNLKLADSAIHLLSPLGGERWDVGSARVVRWSGAGPVDIQMSADGGASYFTVLPAVAGVQATITVPNMSTPNARLRLARYSPFSTSESPGYMAVAPGLVQPWWKVVVDNTPLAGNHTTSLAIDRNGNPRIAYPDDTNGRLRYAAKAGGVWTIDDVAASGIFTPFTGVPDASLTLNSNEDPRIAYFDIINKYLRYASKSGTVWSTELVDNSGTADQYCSLALDAQGNPRISYFDALSHRLRYAAKNGGIWTLETADGPAGSNLGYYNSLALDAQGNPCIAYADFGNFTLKYATKQNGAWTTEIVAPAGTGNMLYISLALDPQGNPHISYHDGSELDLKYASKSGGVWTIETVDPSYFTGYYTSLRLDTEGYPHIAYQDPANGRLMHAWKTGSIWAREVVDAPANGGSGNSVGQYASLAFDTYMNPRMSYYANGIGVLKYASSAIEGIAPLPGATWPVGSVRSVDWNGNGRVDIYLSVDGGVTWLPKQGQATGGHVTFTVPHTPSHFCKIGVSRGVPYSVAVSDSFFTIQTSVALLALLAAPAPNSQAGAVVTWSTDPGPRDLAGYRLERASGGAAWTTVVALTRETSYADPTAEPGTRYRLFAVNGLGEELMLGETSLRPLKPLAAWPLPYRDGNLSIAFATHGGLGGGTGAAEVALFDASGRLVRRVARGNYTAGYQSAVWDGRDELGRRVAAGVYFLRTTSAGEDRKIKLVVLR